MSQTACPVTTPRPPFASKADFLAHGLVETSLHEPLDCSICREPLASSTRSVQSEPLSLPQFNNSGLPRFAISNNTDASHVDSTPHGHDTDAQPPPEPPILIRPCAHIFGQQCLTVWFTTTDSNRCPACNQPLFPERHIHLGFREPTRAMRIEFAKYVERALEDPTTAEQMRLDLMGEWPRMLMREFAVELYRSVGYEVSWEYVDVYGEEEEEEEDSFEGDVEEEEEEEEHESEESEESENEDVEDDI